MRIQIIELFCLKWSVKSVAEEAGTVEGLQSQSSPSATCHRGGGGGEQ